MSVMPECTTPGSGWFAVLPDCDAARAAAAVLGEEATRTVEHASGRPWLVGQWAEDETVVATVGDARVAVVGLSPLTEPRLAALVREDDALGSLDRLGTGPVGGCHLLASQSGRLRSQGTASGLRRLFSARVAGVVVACDRADVLATAIDAGIDERLVALRLVDPLIPHPLAERPLWRGVSAVPAGTALLTDADGSARTRRWWQAPEPELPLAEGAERLAEALADAVAVRTAGGGVISSDLSGGLDSTSLCFLAARGPARLLALTLAGADPANDDLSWARRAAAHLSDTDHHVLPMDELPPHYTGVLRAGEGVDEPFTGGRVRAPFAETARRLAGLGSRLHLSGEGADQILSARPPYLHTTFRTRPRTALTHLRATLSAQRWHPLPTLRALADSRSYGRWLADTARDLSPVLALDGSPALGWQMLRPQLPPWASPDAAAAVRELLRQTAIEAEPLAPTRGQHEVLWSVRNGTRLARQLTRVTSEAGLPTHYPFYDDRVVEAALSVRLHERTTPFAYKPLLVRAMREAVPAELLARRTKGEYSAEMQSGLRTRRADLAELLDQPLLATLGLVDADALRRACLSMFPPRLSPVTLEATLAVETWLRAHAGPASATPALGSEAAA
ncbi:asparagine synthase-related protein [Streptomyces sp. DSM 40750]|uniref:asparagine synthase-related protein n=1 Tax=Streptomyces sp. DSM 40750 TaxID=2801030 RepID=UPI00214B7342|nr:asparagine synthase-related protein [Streptomyces sp. DSM 40750]UUU24184.1 asparagine synthase-related protein [Streptomyces sp. DSM 40750]